MSGIGAFEVKDAAGVLHKMSEYTQDKVVLVVNVASKCGFTPQYQGLQQLYEKYAAKGFVVLGFPCNQFGGQEPGTAEEIAQFCELNYGVTFPVLGKVDVNGDDADPLFKYLTGELPGLLGSKAVKWNFTKFLIGKDGKPLKRFAPQDKPEDLGTEIERVL